MIMIFVNADRKLNFSFEKKSFCKTFDLKLTESCNSQLLVIYCNLIISFSFVHFKKNFHEQNVFTNFHLYTKNIVQLLSL